ncbi:Sec1-like protein [Tuber brumale]|nr:Sec1-like protein [Tuber brumale]
MIRYRKVPPSGVNLASVNKAVSADFVKATAQTEPLHLPFSEPVGLWCKSSASQDHGVDKIFWLQDNVVADVTQQNMAFFVQCTVHNALGLAGRERSTDKCTAHSQNTAKVPGQQFEYKVRCVPRGILVCEKIFPLNFIPLESDLSLALEDRKDHGSIFHSAGAPMNIQRPYRHFTRRTGTGDYARRIADALIGMHWEQDASHPTSSRFALAPSNRGSDFMAPPLTQLTYESLIDETIRIHNPEIEVHPSLVRAYSPSARLAATPSQQTKRRLNDSDTRDFVCKLGTLQPENQSSRIHTGLAEEIMNHTRTDIFNKIWELEEKHATGVDLSCQHDAIPELSALNTPLEPVLPVLCIDCLVGQGLRPRAWATSSGTLFRATATSLSLILLPLKGTSITPATSTRTNYATRRKSLRVIVDELNENSDDIAYVYAGYVRLRVPLDQYVIQKALMTRAPRGEDPLIPRVDASGWSGLPDTFDDLQSGERNAVSASYLVNGSKENEVTVLRPGGRRQDEREIVISTTGFITGDRVMPAATEKQ